MSGYNEYMNSLAALVSYLGNGKRIFAKVKSGAFHGTDIPTYAVPMPVPCSLEQPAEHWNNAYSNVPAVPEPVPCSLEQPTEHRNNAYSNVPAVPEPVPSSR